MATVIDASGWTVVSAEFGGADPKWWISPHDDAAAANLDELWLFKPVKHGKLKEKGTGELVPYRRSDDRSEWLASRLAAALGFPRRTSSWRGTSATTA